MYFTLGVQAFFNHTVKVNSVVVAQLAERSLPVPEVRGSNPDTGKFLKNIYLLLSTVLY